jgi:hypothetical protein
MGGDVNVKLCIQHFYPRGSAPPRWEICFKKCALKSSLQVGYDPGACAIMHLICLVTLIINIYGLEVGISTIEKFTSGRGWGKIET